MESLDDISSYASLNDDQHHPTWKELLQTCAEQTSWKNNGLMSGVSSQTHSKEFSF